MAVAAPAAGKRRAGFTLRVSRSLGLALALCAGQGSFASADPLLAASEAFSHEQYPRVLELLPQDEADPQVQLLRARTLLALERYGQAQQALRGLVVKLPQLRDLIRLLQGEALMGLGKFDAAAARFRSAARAKGSRWIDLAWRRRAAAFLAAKRYDQAAAAYAHLLRVQADAGDRPQLQLAHATCQSKLGQKSKAAESLQQIWLRWPASEAAPQAQLEFTRLRAAGVRLPPLSFAQRLERVRRLRQAKSFSQALEELELLRQENGTAAHQRSLVVEEVGLRLKVNQPEQALALLQALPESSSLPPWLRRSLMAKSLALAGRHEEGVQLLLEASYRPGSKMTRAQLAEVSRAARHLAEHAQYGRALELYEELARQQPAAKSRARHLAWLRYRAGDYGKASEGLAQWAKTARGEKSEALYWLARAQGKAGQREQALALYRQVLERDPFDYYGLLARSRLAEAGQLTLMTPSSCPAGETAPVPDTRGEVLPRLETLITRHQDLYPNLLRSKLLWQLGMLEDARRELRLVAIDASWVRDRGRPRGWIQRPSVERLWQGGPVPRRRWTKRERAIFKEGVALRHDLGELMTAAGLSYFGWKLGPRDADLLRQRYPRSYPFEVLEIAQRFELDPHLIWAIMRTESHYRLDVVSRVGATGLMQIMPTTGQRIARELGLQGFEHQQLYTPRVNLLMAGWYLGAVKKKFQGQIPLMAAAYNGGPHNVARWLEQRGAACAMDEFIEEIPFRESRRYAKKIVRLISLYERLYCHKNDRRLTNTLLTRTEPQPDF